MKKIITILSMLALLFVVSCNSEPQTASHEHYYKFTDYTLNEDGKVVKTFVCSCGEQKTEIIENAIVATPEDAQAKLDALKSGETLFFSDGEYSSILDIRNAKGNSKYYSSKDKTKELQFEELTKANVYFYERELNDVTLIASKNAVFKGPLYLNARHVYGTEGKAAWDPVREIEMKSTSLSYYADFKINNLTIDGFKFAGESNGGFIALNIYSTDSFIHGLTIRNCTLKGNNKTSDYCGIRIKNDFDGKSVYKDILIENVDIDTAYQGIYTQNIENLTVRNSSISNTGYNAIAFQYSVKSGELPASVVVIDNVKASNVDNKAIRIGDKADLCDITISNCSFNNAVDSNNELLKSSSIPARFTFNSNSYDDKAMDDLDRLPESKIIAIK